MNDAQPNILSYGRDRFARRRRWLQRLLIVIAATSAVLYMGVRGRDEFRHYRVRRSKLARINESIEKSADLQFYLFLQLAEDADFMAWKPGRTALMNVCFDPRFDREIHEELILDLSREHAAGFDRAIVDGVGKWSAEERIKNEFVLVLALGHYKSAVAKEFLRRFSYLGRHTQDNDDTLMFARGGREAIEYFRGRLKGDDGNTWQQLADAKQLRLLGDRSIDSFLRRVAETYTCDVPSLEASIRAKALDALQTEPE